MVKSIADVRVGLDTAGEQENKTDDDKKANRSI
jgi:hypothetical protein